MSEAVLACNVLNAMADMGRPAYTPSADEQLPGKSVTVPSRVVQQRRSNRRSPRSGLRQRVTKGAGSTSAHLLPLVRQAWPHRRSATGTRDQKEKARKEVA